MQKFVRPLNDTSVLRDMIESKSIYKICNATNALYNNINYIH